MKKIIVIENKKNLVVGVDKIPEKYKDLLTAVEVEYSTYNTVVNNLEFGRIHKYVGGQLKHTPYWCDFVIVEAWLTIMHCKYEATIPPFAIADSEYHKQTYETRVLRNYGFKFERVYNLNGRQYDGCPHGNRTLMMTIIKK